MRTSMTTRFATGAAALALVIACGGAGDGARGSQERRLFVASARENGDGTVTLPLHRGTSLGRVVWYVILDASDGAVADRLGVNESQKLARVRGSGAVQRATRSGDAVDFPATVDFAAGTGMAEAGYSPLVELDGAILNAPHVLNGTGRHPKLVSVDLAGGTATLEETEGFSGGKAVRYVSTDASAPVAAALENVPLVPALNEAPTAGEDGTDQARTSLTAFVNGQTGRDNPERQGIASALADHLSPLNILRWAPNQGRYSPLWDVHLAEWTPAAVAAGLNLRQDDFGDVLGLVDHGLVTGPGGAPFAAAGFIVNCPIVSSE